ncbi:hypothetical protein [Roseomonas genomospecies 6]|uniref:Uncharacterized protein n=1 Tax=Roseomonas genomospecies 6 TaxID=214106 RepID=A0A9W7KNR8_9PROT|nr:hypothetical protein [Roseomonas genomospecies 6]KAA0675791.1 hypothetical protein DS843_29885 [Roseomonas genomospecies 6]
MEKVTVPQNSAASAPDNSTAGGVKQRVDFELNGARIVAFLDSDQPNRPGGIVWPQVAESYAAEQGIGMSDARWYSVQPYRFANGRPNVNEYRPNGQTWKFETNLNTAAEIVRRLGLDLDSLPLDI